MKRFQDCEVIYDANIIVYYCFLDGNVRILELTNKVRKMTQNLINSNCQVVAPYFIINELKIKGIAKIIQEYLDNPFRLIGVPRKPRKMFNLRLMNKIEKNFSDMEGKSWFRIKNYVHDDDELKYIQKFFLSRLDTDKMDKLLNKKNRSIPYPSDEDLYLILFSKENSSSLISNDYDITCFSEELFDEELCYEIISLSDISLSPHSH